MKRRYLTCALSTLLVLVASQLGAEDTREPTSAILDAFSQEVRMLLQRAETREERSVEGIRFTVGALKGR